MLKNEKQVLVDDIMAIIISKAAVILFNTPVPTEIPSDSFENDYEIDIVKIEEDLDLD